MRSIFNFILIFSLSSFAHSASDLDRWNSQQGRTVRAQAIDQLEKTSYREIRSSPSPKSDIKRIYPEIELKANTPEGKSRVVADAVLDTNKDAVKRDWKKNLKDLANGRLKGGVATFAFGYGVDKLLDAADWILDPKNNQIQRKSIPTDAGPSSSEYYGIYQNVKYYSPEAFCEAWNANRSYPIIGLFPSLRVFSSSSADFRCDNSTGGNYISLKVYKNPSYDPSSLMPDTIPVTDQEIEKAVDDIIDNADKDPKKKAAADSMAKSSYARIWDDQGNMMEIGAEITDATKDILKDDDPKSSGKTENTPKIQNPNESESTVKPDDTNKEYLEDEKGDPVRDSQGNLVKNPDYNPNQSPSYSIKTEYPLFCDWASIVCDWIDWTRTEDDLPPQDMSDLTVEIEYEKKEYEVKWLENCPAPIYETFSIGGHSKNVKIIDYQFICQAGDIMKPWVISFATLAGLFIILGYHSRSE